MLPEGWKRCTLEQCAEINPSTKLDIKIRKATFLAMPDVSEAGQIIGEKTIDVLSVANGYTRFQENDVLVAKITPCFENGKGALARGLVNNVGFGSTEFHVLRAKSKITPDLLHVFTRTHRFRSAGESSMSGSAGQKRIPAEFVRSFSIDLPPLNEQARICAVLSTWDEAIVTTEHLLANSRTQRLSLLSKVLSVPAAITEVVDRDRGSSLPPSVRSGIPKLPGAHV